jgi:hypothetical protein
VAKGTIVPFVEPPRPQIPIDYSWAQQLGLIRKPTSFVSTISDERGDELKYYNMPISQVIQVKFRFFSQVHSVTSLLSLFIYRYEVYMFY